MTSPTLVQRARQLSPQHWKGQQTVIRRLSRTQRLPTQTMHDALRRASKLHQADSPMHKMVTFRPNNDTPPDLRAEYLRNPHAFGINSREDILAWSRQASNATLLKMEMYTGISALVLFERERPEATALLQRLADKRIVVEFRWVQEKLASMPLSQKQLIILDVFTEIGAANIWVGNIALLANFVAQSENYATVEINQIWLDIQLDSCGLIELLGPFESVNMHKATLTASWQRLVLADAHVQESHADDAQRAAVSWHQRAPSRQDCLDLAAMLEGTYAAESASFELLWQHRNPIFLPWISMMGTNAEEGQLALDMYQQFDPGLLTFTTIANALANPQLDTIDNVSELLCP